MKFQFIIFIIFNWVSYVSYSEPVINHDEDWICYPAYSFAPDKCDIQQTKNIICRINEKNIKNCDDVFFIIGEQANKGKPKQPVVIYFSKEFWRGYFLYNKQQKIIILCEQPDNANCSIKIFSYENKKWNLSFSTDLFNYINLENWPEEKPWRGYISSIMYDENKSKITITIDTAQGNYEIHGDISRIHHIINVKCIDNTRK